MNLDTPSIYVGVTARSIKERAKEHWNALRSKDKDSHILKHWTLHHESVGEPEFVMKVVGEFSRCKISRLSLGQLDGDKGKEGDGKGLGDELKQDWTIGLLQRRDGLDRDSRKQLGRVISSKSM